MKRYLTFCLCILAIFLFSSAKNSDSLPLKGVKEMDINNAVKLVQQEHGNIVFLYIFATWCGPCKRDFPVLDEIAKQYKGKGLTFIILSIDEDVKKVENYVNELNINFDVIHILSPNLDELRNAIKTIGGNFKSSIPYSIIYNRNGYPEKQWSGSKSFKEYQKIFDLLH